MHEATIVQALLDEAARHAAARTARAVTRLRVRVGELAGVDAPLLARAWEVFREGTLCAGAPLDLVGEAARWACPRCARPVARGARLRCPACDVPARLEAGEDVVLERLEMEV